MPLLLLVLNLSLLITNEKNKDLEMVGNISLRNLKHLRFDNKKSSKSEFVNYATKNQQSEEKSVLHATVVIACYESLKI